MFAGADKKAIGGHGTSMFLDESYSSTEFKPMIVQVLAHASATRIMLRKGRGEERVAKIHDSVGPILLRGRPARTDAQQFFQAKRPGRVSSQSLTKLEAAKLIEMMPFPVKAATRSVLAVSR